MESFAEPYTRQGDDISIAQVRSNIAELEAEHRKAGIPLSGRIIHVCHYLPLSPTLTQKQPPSSDIGVLSPPATPPTKSAEVPPSEHEDVAAPSSTKDSRNLETDSKAELVDEQKATWSFAPRHGHAAMISGIRSLSATHEQLIVGWTGDIFTSPTDKVPVDSVTPQQRADFEAALKTYHPKESDPDDERDGKTKYVPVWLDDKVAHGHYDGYCKQTLWPLFHYLLWQDVATEYSSADSHYPFYEAANAAFARRIGEIYRPGDLIWVHDYHLLLVPKLVRESIPDAVIGLFVHTPFPSSEVFRCLPRRKEILDGMLGANLVCFQTYSYSRHFLSTCIRVCGYETNLRGIDVEGHVTAVMHCPVGIDAERVARDITRPGIKPKFEALRTLYEGKKIIVGRDKLDVVKGVLQKLRAFEKLLQDYPQWVGNVVMIQVTSPALTDSPKLERMVSELVAHINGEYGSLDFIPVHHYHQTLKKDEFYALLSVADLAVITPLRDGMNTTSMEYVIAQNDTGKNPSVLSEFMGISKNMDNALLVNPWNLGVRRRRCNNQGLIMDPAEKAARHEKLYKVVTTHTSHTWGAVLVKMLLSQMGLSGTARQTPYIPREQLEGCYQKAKKRLFLFDYDVRPKNIVWIISGRDGAFLEQHLGHLTNVGFSAEHGGFVKERGSSQWTNFTKNLDMSWMAERTTGSHIEMKKSSITWHYRATDPEWGQFQCRQCQDLVALSLSVGFRPIAVNKVVVSRMIYPTFSDYFLHIFAFSQTDEDMFRALLLFPPGVKKVTLPAPVSVTLVDDPKAQPVELKIESEAVFTTAVGHSSKRTLAVWHVNTPHEVMSHTPPSNDTRLKKGKEKANL
ncbi:trehalose-6-phosphate phosphatase [Pholiota molesta]|nr:trehalose-6-phosphate phosphatase [Pholiota molesta]